MESIIGFLPYLLFLACPAMMIACYVGMRGMGGSTTPAAVDTSVTSLRDLPPAEQVAHLQAQLSRLQEEQAVIATQIRDLGHMAPASGSTAQDARTPEITLPARA